MINMIALALLAVVGTPSGEVALMLPTPAVHFETAQYAVPQLP
jgi:hypothetical protein